MKKKTSIILGAALCFSFALSGCAPTDANSAGPVSDVSFEEGTTMARLSEAGAITIGSKFDQPLFGLKGLDNKPAGFDVEIAKIIAADLGIPEDGITFIETPSKVRDEAVSSGKADLVIATYTINDDRKTRVTFGGPYYLAGTQLLVPKGSAITGNDSLSDPSVKVCTVTGASYIDALTEFLNSPDQLVLFDVYSKCGDALRTGQVDAVAADTSILLGIGLTGPGEVAIVGDSFDDQYYGIGMKKGDIALCEFVNETLANAVEDGRYAEAWAKTAGTVDPAVPPLPQSIPCE